MTRKINEFVFKEDDPEYYKRYLEGEILKHTTECIMLGKIQTEVKVNATTTELMHKYIVTYGRQKWCEFLTDNGIHMYVPVVGDGHDTF